MHKVNCQGQHLCLCCGICFFSIFGVLLISDFHRDLVLGHWKRIGKCFFGCMDSSWRSLNLVVDGVWTLSGDRNDDDKKWSRYRMKTITLRFAKSEVVRNELLFFPLLQPLRGSRYSIIWLCTHMNCSPHIKLMRTLQNMTTSSSGICLYLL